jgi:hypothetical protein
MPKPDYKSKLNLCNLKIFLAVSFACRITATENTVIINPHTVHGDAELTNLYEALTYLFLLTLRPVASPAATTQVGCSSQVNLIPKSHPASIAIGSSRIHQLREAGVVPWNAIRGRIQQGCTRHVYYFSISVGQ